MNLYLLISMIFASISGVFLITRQYQMLQQNSYFPSRYTKWLKENTNTVTIFIFLISSLLFCFGLSLIQTIFAAVVVTFSILTTIKGQKKSIKKLVFTARVKRLYFITILIFLGLITINIVFGDSLIGRISAAICFLLGYVTPITVFLCWSITFPIENAFSKYYILDAKKILKSHKNLKVIGITGSYGKTTSKFILTRILSEKFNVVCTPHSFNTPMGVVRTVRENLKPQTEIFVCEMGAKNVGDIKEICEIANPQIAMITSVGPQHLETFKSVDNVFKTKFELADAITDKTNIFVNGDSLEIAKRIKKSKYTVYGTDNKCNFKAYDISYGRNGSEFTVKLGDKEVRLTSKLLGLHSIMNITGAVAIAHKLGVSAEDIKFAVASLKPYEHRLELKTSVKGSLLIDDAYNSNPEGCLEAVRVLGSFDGMKKVIITPGLIELGDKEYECNYNLGLEASKYCDIMIFVGKNRSIPMMDAAKKSKFPEDKVFVASSFMEAMEIYSKYADNNSVVLLENDLPDNYLN